MSEWLNELVAWWAALSPEWAFLMLLPFLVVAVALLAHWRPREQAIKRPAPLRRRHHHRGSH